MVLQPDEDLIGNSDSFFKQRKGRIVVVGNSAVDKDHSELVDTADCVLRFSKVIHYNTGLVGTKTDIICLRAFRAFYSMEENPGEGFHISKYLKNVRNFKPWEECKEYWLVGKWLNYHKDFAVYAKYYPRIGEIPTRLIHVSPIHDFIFGHHKGQKGPITNGIVVVIHLLSLRILMNWKIQLIGFSNFRRVDSHEGENGDITAAHDVEKDKQVLQSLAQAGYIELCD